MGCLTPREGASLRPWHISLQVQVSPLAVPCVGSSRSRALGKAVPGDPSAQQGRKEKAAAGAAAAGQ